MSSEEHEPTQLVQARDIVRSTIADLANLAREGCDTLEFHRALLDRIVAALAAVGGAVWSIDPQRGITLSYQHNMQITGLGDSPNVSAAHSRLLYQTLASAADEVTAIAPRSGSEEVGNSSDYLLLLGRVTVDQKVTAIIEVAQRGDANPAAQSGFLQFLSQISLLAGDFYRHRSRYELQERQALWTRLEEFTRTIHQSLDPRETAYTIVNEGRRLIECDRVSLALVRGSHCHIVAISGQDQIDQRSNTVRLLAKLATAVVRAEEVLWYRGDTSELPPQVEKALEAYVDESHTKMLAVFPLSASLILSREEDAVEEKKSVREAAERTKVYAALIVEQIENSQINDSFRRRCDIVAAHTASAVKNSIEHHRIFLMPLWKTIGKSRILLAAEYLPKTLGVLLGVLLIIGVLLFLPWDFRVHCTGRLEPLTRQRIFAPLDGEVRNVLVDHNSSVESGDLLAELYSIEIENTGKKLLGEGREIDEQMASLARQLTNENRALQPHELTQLQGQWAVMQTRKKTNEAQLELFAIQQAQEQVRAPITGLVVTWDVQNKLRSRPVLRSQFLLEIADPSGAWCLELSMPERLIGYLIDYQRQHPEKPLRVRFVPAADPHSRYSGTIDRIADRAEVHADTTANQINTVLIRVTLDEHDSLPVSIRPGAECAASVDCGQASLGFVLLSDLIAFIHRNIIFRFF